MTMQFFGAVLIGATLLCGVTGCAENGEPAQRGQSFALVYDDLDLATSEGAAAAMARIEAAADDACAWARASTFGDRRESVCKDAFIKDAVADADAPLVAALYENSRPAQR